MSSQFQDLDREGMRNLAVKLVSEIKAGDVIALYGDLGTGKTFFSGCLIRAILGKGQEVLSPTFNLVHTYDSSKGSIWHFDLYRLKQKKEVYELGIEDAMNFGITIIEWPEIIEDMLPANTKRVTINASESGQNFRNISLS